MEKPFEYGFEVDNIADWAHTFAIEIKSSAAFEQKMSANIRKYQTLRGEDAARKAVFYLGDVTLSINGTDYIGWRDWDSFMTKNL